MHSISTAAGITFFELFGNELHRFAGRPVTSGFVTSDLDWSLSGILETCRQWCSQGRGCSPLRNFKKISCQIRIKVHQIFLNLTIIKISIGIENESSRTSSQGASYLVLTPS